jgi:hypothetical protein
MLSAARTTRRSRVRALARTPQVATTGGSYVSSAPGPPSDVRREHAGPSESLVLDRSLGSPSASAAPILTAQLVIAGASARELVCVLWLSLAGKIKGKAPPERSLPFTSLKAASRKAALALPQPTLQPGLGASIRRFAGTGGLVMYVAARWAGVVVDSFRSTIGPMSPVSMKTSPGPNVSGLQSDS